ncbi:MAG: mercury(II) reductase [FCB group bacterium]|nr:mercury(II) reductase [FCB group bacterium]
MKTKTVKLTIKGMTCEDCAISIAKLLDVPGIVDKKVSFGKESADVTYDAEQISAEEIVRIISETGRYGVTGFNRENNGADGTREHLIIVGGGSAAFAAALEAHARGAGVTMINDGLPIGGTCVNVGCVPSKNLIRAAETLHRANNNPFPGIRTRGSMRDFSAVINQKNTLVENLRREKYINVVKDLENFRLVEGRAEIISPTAVTVNGEVIAGDKLLIATGARPHIPEIEGLEDVPYLTNEGAFALDYLPESIIVMGGRYVALEISQLFARFGSKVTILQRSDRILPTESADLTEALAGYLREEGVKIITGNNFQKVSEESGRIAVVSEVNGELKIFKAEKLIVATGRTPNTADMGLEAIGVELKKNGSINVDDTLQTSVPGIYAAGDVLGENMFVYTAAYEGKLAARNALSDEKITRDYSVLPWVIFTDPQVTGVGLDEAQARAQGLRVETSTLSLDHVPRAIAARDTRGFIKLIRDIDTDKLVGARILAPEGAELIMEVSLAVKYGITVKELVDMFHPYLTMAEGVKLAAITFAKDVRELSCCAT